MSTAIQQFAEMQTPPTTKIFADDDDANWAAVVERDARLDGSVYYAVRSTGVYCKPSCPSRRPRREQVTFFTEPQAAEAAGFRACLRCHPRQVNGASPQAKLVKRISDYIEENLEGTITLRTIAAAVGSSPYHLQRVFKRATGVSPHAYAESRRIAVFKTSLRTGQSVTDAIYEAGFNSSSRLYERSNSHLGMTPAAYRKGGQRQEISYAIGDSPLGRVLVATTEKGICKLSLGENDRHLTSGLFGEFPKALITQDDEKVGTALKAVVDYLSARTPKLTLPLDVAATAFQMRVWRELQKIPLGKTRTYQEIAQRLANGKDIPLATRAVANACASNPVALVVPCHRVVRKNGAMGGYRWGAKRKGQLLQMELQLAAKASQAK
jgi:AraC family transcriptional regulator of adaptative response/methylated-DNA-[protein]-cysteine methyltransferase